MPISRDLGFDGYQLRQDFTGISIDSPLYLGYAPPGVASGQPAWIVYKFTMDASNRITLRQLGRYISNQVHKIAWDDRAVSTVEYV